VYTFPAAGCKGHPVLMKAAIGFVFLAVVCRLPGQGVPVDPLAPLTIADVANGKRLFEAQCAPCHGIDGRGGKGANLAMARLKHAVDNQELVSVIREGIQGTGMLRAWQLDDHELLQVAAYVRSFARVEESAIPGDPAHGRAVFEARGCSGCHIVNGAGSSLGPELTEVGARRGPQYLRKKLLNPGAETADGFLLIRAVLADGREVRGIRVNEDSFTIQIKDAGNRFHSFRKTDLARLEKEFGKTLMPSFGAALSAGELDDLVAYLAGLRGGT
jgi:cytochrome c oxidase cbb3-type subunit 3